MSFPNYNNVFIFNKNTTNILDQLPNKNKINYLVFDENFRKFGLQRTTAELLTDEKQ